MPGGDPAVPTQEKAELQYACVCVRVHVCMYVHVYACVCVGVHVCMTVYTHVHVCVCVHCMDVCMCTHRHNGCVCRCAWMCAHLPWPWGSRQV